MEYELGTVEGNEIFFENGVVSEQQADTSIAFSYVYIDLPSLRKYKTILIRKCNLGRFIYVSFFTSKLLLIRHFSAKLLLFNSDFA